MEKEKIKELSKVARYYIGERANTELFNYQEFCRIESSKYNGQYAGTGWISLMLMCIKPKNFDDLIMEDNKDFQELWEIITKTFKLFVIRDKKFLSLIDEIQKKVPNFPQNVRNFVKQLWSYPYEENEYHPFIKTGLIIDLPLNIKEFKFHIGKNNHVDLVYKKNKSIVDIFWKNKSKWYKDLIKDNEKYGFDELVIPPFKSHITIINSYYAEKYKETCKKLVDEFNKKELDLKLLEVCHGFDEKFALYETVVVLEIQSETIKDFIKEFNKITNENIGNASMHITFAVRLRK